VIAFKDVPPRTCFTPTGLVIMHYFKFEFDFLVLRSNEPCVVKDGPLPTNVNTAQNAAMVNGF
jgi:hypothetical protein